MIRLFVAAALLAIPMTSADAKGRAMSLTETNRAIVADFARIFYTERNPKVAFAKYVAPDYVQHNPNARDGRDAALAMLGPLFGGPGATFTVERILVDGEMAMIHVHGQPDPKGKGVAVADIYRLSHGKIVEHWDVLQPIPDTTINPHPFF